MRPVSSPPSCDRRRHFFLRLRGGFTILEVAMATFVMALGIASSIIAMQSGFRHLAEQSLTFDFLQQRLDFDIVAQSVHFFTQRGGLKRSTRYY